jgi:hypothetical protein
MFVRFVSPGDKAHCHSKKAFIDIVAGILVSYYPDVGSVPFFSRGNGEHIQHG